MTAFRHYYWSIFFRLSLCGYERSATNDSISFQRPNKFSSNIIRKKKENQEDEINGLCSTHEEINIYKLLLKKTEVVSGLNERKN